MPVPVFISYSHDSEMHSERVLWLADVLREFGVDAEIDQYHSNPEVGWASWMMEKIEWAKYVLMICTRTYSARFNGADQFGRGKGVKWEGAIITQSLYESESRNRKFVPLLFDGGDPDDIPLVLRGFTHYPIVDREISSIDPLYRYLTDQPRVVKRDIGDVQRRPRRQIHPNDSRFWLEDSYDKDSQETKGFDTEDRNESVKTGVGVYSVDLHIDAEFESFDEEKQRKLVKVIRRLMDISDEIKIVRKRRGSVVLTIELPPDMAERLKWAVLSGELLSLGVYDAVLTEGARNEVLDRSLEDDRDIDISDLPAVDTISSVYHLNAFISPEAAELFETIESILRACIDRGIPLETHSRKFDLFKCFRAAARLGLLETRARDLLSSELVVRRVAERWQLPSDIAHSVANGYKLAPIYVSRLRILWSFTRIWTEWGYALKGLRKPPGK